MVTLDHAPQTEQARRTAFDPSQWRTRASAMLNDVGLCSNGEFDATSQDRRWLWRLEAFLAVSGTTDAQRELGRDLAYYLHQTCPHHWHFYGNTGPDDWYPTHVQCLYCNLVVADPSPPPTEASDVLR